ncbi:glycosyltransferase family 4 protein [Qipengyuania sp. CAU 1752]
MMQTPQPVAQDQHVPLRIAYLMQQYPVPTQTFAKSDIAALREQGNRVDVFTIKPGATDSGSDVDVLRPSWRGILRWPSALWAVRRALPLLVAAIARQFPVAPKTAMAALMCLPRAAEIAATINAERYDVAHLFWSRHAVLVLAFLEQFETTTIRSAFIGAYDLVADDFLVELAFENAQVIFSHARANREFLEARADADTRLAIIPRGIPLLPLDPTARPNPALWVTASGLVREKNVEGVLRAFAAARAMEPHLTLEIYGDGPDKPRLERLAGTLGCKQDIRFEGHVEREELFAAMQRADIFLLLSTKASERLPNVIKEALWAGCHIICSNSPGIDELVPSEDFGLVVDPQDEAAILTGIQSLIRRDKSVDEERARRVRGFVADQFSAAVSMGRYVDQWREMIDLQGRIAAGSGSTPRPPADQSSLVEASPR